MFDKLDDLLIRFEELMSELSEPDVANNPEHFRKLMKEQSDLAPIVAAYKEYKQCKQNIADSLAMLEKNFSLAKEFGAECVTLEGRSVSDTLLAFAREKQITKFIIGHTRRSRFVRLFRGSTINKFIDRSENIQVIVTPMSAY